MADWYLISRKSCLFLFSEYNSYYIVAEAGGGGLLKEYYDSSVSKALVTIYPEYPWDKASFLFLTEEENPWNNMDFQIKFMDKVNKKLKLEKLDDWYIVHKLFSF